MNLPCISRGYAGSFITYMLISRNGIYKDGRTSFDVNEEDILTLYPDYSVDTIPESIRQWIEYGIWEEDKIYRISLHRIKANAPETSPDKKTGESF